MSDSLRPHGLYSPWNSPGQNTGVGSLIPSAADLPEPGIEAGPAALQVDSLPTELSGKPFLMVEVTKRGYARMPKVTKLLKSSPVW